MHQKMKSKFTLFVPDHTLFANPVPTLCVCQAGLLKLICRFVRATEKLQRTTVNASAKSALKACGRTNLAGLDASNRARRVGGGAMKASKGKANPAQVNELLKNKLS
jgi:hypothetical protein